MSTQSDNDLINAFLAATENLSQMEAGEAAGVSQKTVSSWRRGERRMLSVKTRRALIGFLETRQKPAQARGWTGAPATEERLEAPAPNYAGLGIDLPGLEQLEEHARVRFDSFMHDLIGQGCDRGALERAGRTLLAPIIEGDIRAEGEQLRAIRALIPVAETVAGERQAAPPDAAMPSPALSATEVAALEALDEAERLLEREREEESRRHRRQRAAG